MAVSDLFALDDVVNGEFNVLGQKVMLPAALLIDDVFADKESRAGDGTAGTEQGTRVVDVALLVNKPQ